MHAGLNNPRLLTDPILAGLLSPMDAGTFFSCVWGREPVLLNAGQNFNQLVSAAEIDQLLRFADANYRVVKYEDKQSKNYDIPRVENVPDLYAIYQAWDEGYSLSIDYLNRFWPAIIELCQHLEAVLNFQVGANLYFTPPGDQCFPPHYDGHEVIVLQVEGEKDWTIWGLESDYPPTTGSPIDDPESLPDPVMETTLREGDVLYIPQGFPHQAKTTQGRSLHITLQILPVTKKTFLDLMLLAANHLKVKLPPNLPADINNPGSRPGLNNALPAGFLCRDDLGSDLRPWVDESVIEILVNEARNAIRHGMTYDRQPATTGYFGFEGEITSVNGKSVFKKRNQSLCATGASERESWLGFHRHRVVAARGMTQAFRFIADLGTETFCLNELPCDLPDDIQHQVMIRLVNLGLLSIESAK